MRVAPTHLDLKALRKQDELALGELFGIVERAWGRRLSDDEVRRIYEEGIRITLTGSGLHSGPDLAYGLFLTRVSRALPLRWTLQCVSANGAPHSVILQRRDRDKIIVAGSLHRGSFAGLSSTWIVHETGRSGRYSLGQFVNNAVLSYYRIPRYAMA